MDLAGILNQEARALEEAGATVIQFDEPAILKFKDDLPLLKKTSEIVTQGLGAKTVLCTYFQDVSGLAPQLYELPFKVFVPVPPHQSRLAKSQINAGHMSQ